MSFFDIVLSPFIFIIKQIFLFSYDLTQDYGLAIILLSFGVSLLLLPIFIYIERVKRKDDVIKQKMKPLADEIKRCYKGQERYYYLKTLNRQFNYSPLKALLPVLSLLLQIPFFIAAYQFLEGYEPLNGVSFWFIKDLAQPDGLFGAVNFLPIAMTVVNLITAYFYTRNGDASERRQMLVVAAIFLVLLFNLPSGLVLYWTMNNVFSFFRLFITNPEVFKKSKERKIKRQQYYQGFVERYKQIKPKLSGTMIFLVVLAILSQFNWAFQNDFNDIAQRFLFALTGGIVATFVIAALVALHKTDSEKPKDLKSFFESFVPVFRPAFIIIITVAILSQINWALQHNANDIVPRVLMAFIAGTLLTFIFAVLVLYYQDYWSLKATNIVYRFSELSFGFKVSYFILAVALIYSQLNWAQTYYFDDIVLRLSLAVSLSYLIVIAIANLIGSIAKTSLFTPQALKGEFLKRKSLFWKVLIGLVFIAVATQINWAFHYNFNDIYLRLAIALVVSVTISALVIFIIIFFGFYGQEIRHFIIPRQVFFSLAFLAIYFQLASVFYFNGLKNDLTTIAFWAVISAQVVGIFRFFSHKAHYAKSIFASVLALLIIISALQMLFLWFPESFSLIQGEISVADWLVNENGKYSFVNLGLVFLLILLPFYYSNQKPGNFEIKPNWFVYILSILYLTGFVFLWNPLSIYSTYPDIFDFPAMDILTKNFRLFAVSTVILFAFYLILPKRIKKHWLIFMLSVTIIGFFHNTLFPIDLGNLQENKFINEGNLAQPVIKYITEALAFITIVFFVEWLIRKKFRKQIIVALVLLNSVLITQGLIEASQTGSFLVKPKVVSDSTPVISLSKDKKNIIYIISDMFHGWNVEKMIEQEPDLASQLKGFTWYPNTISISSNTCASISALLGGYNYSLDKLNKDASRNMEEKVTQVTEEFYAKVKSAGYNFTANKMIYSTIDKNKFDTYIPNWHDGWDVYNSILNIGLPRELGYTILWENAAFYTAPLFIKPIIYNGGRWLHGNVEKNLNTSQTQPYNFLRLLPYISNAKSEQPNFVYIHSMASHHPWDIVDAEGRLQMDQGVYANNKWVLETFVKWFNWLQENDVYDNTKIVMVSDHGPHWRRFNGILDSDMPITINPSLNIEEKKIMEMFPLMLVKDFNSSGKLKKDWRFMSNADAPAILFNENDPTKGNPIKGREITVTNTDWVRKIWLENTLKLRHKIVVKDNALDLNNWEKIE